MNTKLQPIAKKLNADIAATNPSRHLYSSLFQTPGLWCVGCCACTAAAYFESNLKKPGISAPTSISACHMFLPVPSGAQQRAAVATHNIGCFQGDCTSITQGHGLPMAASLQSSTNSILILQKTMNVNGMQQYSKHEL